jgi:hypothetical protein
MRVVSSQPVVHSAESIARKILDTYLKPDKTFVELRDMANNGTIDLLRDFSAACRDELEDIEARQFWTAARSASVTPEVKDHLWSALTSLASAPIVRDLLVRSGVSARACRNRSLVCGDKILASSGNLTAVRPTGFGWFSGSLPIDMASAQRDDIVHGPCAALIRPDNDRGHSRTHVCGHGVHKVGIQRLHHDVATQPCRGAQRHAGRAPDQSDQRPGRSPAFLPLISKTSS